MRARASLALLALAQWVAPAAAQSSDPQNITIDALATVRQPEPTLSITGATDLSFGKVTLPTGAVTTCLYVVGHGGQRSAFADGIAATGTTCAFQDSAQAVATVDVTCQAGQSLTFSRYVESPMQSEAIDFTVLEDQIGFTENGAHATTSACAGGQAVLRIGGRLAVNARATAHDSATVGRITVDLFYGAYQCLGCQ